MSENWTIEDFKNYRENQRKQENSKNKFLNKKVLVDGITFHSKKEAAYYSQCKVRKMAGHIVDFKMQVRYDFTINGVKVGYYKADFVEYVPGGGIQVIDVKSDFTRKLPQFRRSKKLMKALFDIEIIEK